MDNQDGMRDKVIEILNIIRPFLVNDGGNVEFVELKNDIVYVRVFGACVNCMALDVTLTDMILSSLREEIPTIVDVVAV